MCAVEWMAQLLLLLGVAASCTGFLNRGGFCAPECIGKTGAPLLLLRTSAQSLEENAAIAEVDGPFDASQLKGYWGNRPLLIRNAFVGDLESWPTWKEIVQLACWSDVGDDDKWNAESGESARLIQHIPDKLDSFCLELGPFEAADLEDVMLSGTKERPWTLVVNDVDRYKPKLSDWMDGAFSFMPRWRRDDAQISLAMTGGGIGPHVDNYDVFLIQATGQRQWLIDSSSKLSVAAERAMLVPEIPVSILQLDDVPYMTLLLNAGDMLYLPPRVVHWGTAASDDCMTLSVGCRSPSAAELTARVAECIQMSTQRSAVQCLTDSEDFFPCADRIGPSLSRDMKDSTKMLVRTAIEDLFQDESAWDELVGRITTETLRYSDSSVRPYSEEEELYRETWGETPADVLRRVIQLRNKATLVRAPGISYATSLVCTHIEKVYRLFANGCMWEVSNDESAAIIFGRLERGESVDGTTLDAIGSRCVVAALEELVQKGFLKALKQI